MPVAEYMLHAQGNTRQVPDFIGDRGHWFNPSDHTYVGWISETRDFYVPDTIEYLTKESFVQRILSIHSVYPYKKRLEDEETREEVEMTIEEVTLQAETWYDNFVVENTGK
jgi:hypothetical protein